MDPPVRLDGPHRRYDPLRRSWVLVSPARDRRPWAGATEPAAEPRASYDPACHLCPGNLRTNGERNPDYGSTFVFPNDHPALTPEWAADRLDDGLFVAEPARGVARVLCFAPRHDASLGSLPPASVRSVVDLWADQTTELGADHRWVQVFENRGEAMGASSPHPHGQVWAGDALPTEAAREDESQRAHHAEHRRTLLADVIDRERGGVRVIADADGWLAWVPFWASWPFEAIVAPTTVVGRLDDLDGAARDALAGLLREVLQQYDGLFEREMPYSMGWHQAPFGDESSAHWHLHAHVYPPLLRANARKFMVGYELLAEPQRDLTPEDAAACLRAASPSPR